MRPLVHLVAWTSLVACATSELPDSNAPPMASSDDAASEGVRVAVEWIGSGRVRYAPSVLSATRSTLRVVVHNERSTSVDTSGLTVRLVVARDGVRFPCDAELGSPPRSSEATQVAPGKRAAFERSVDCPLPLVGEYRVKVAVAFGRDGGWARGRDVRDLSLTVSAAPDVEPRALAGATGLWASLGASGLMASSPGDAKGKIAVAVINGSAEPIDLPPVRLAMRVYRERNPIPCEDDPIALATPPRLLPGQSFAEPVAVSCLGLGTPGRYEIVGRLIVARPSGGDIEQTIGRLRVEVASDPARLYPQ